LQDTRERDAQQTPQNGNIKVEVARQDVNALRAAHEPVELVEHADAAASERGERCAGDAEVREGAEAED